MEQLTLAPEFGTFERICQYWQENHPLYLAQLRELAVRICRSRGEVTIDDVREEMELHKIPSPKQIGVDERIFGGLLRGCSRLTPIGRRQTLRVEWAKRVGVNRDQVTIYGLAAA